MLITRRDFLLAAAGAALARHGRARPTPARLDTLRVGLVSRGDDADATRGARLGAEEAARVATLVGGAVTMATAADADALLAAPVHVLVGGADDAEAERLSASAERAGVLFLNVGAAADALRAERCRPLTFHVAASARMRHAAGAGADTAEDAVRLWHDSLVQYGAAQLNDRFHARFEGRPMRDDAWAAWLAVKVAAESSLRARSVVPAALAAYLARPGVRFDGHKGRALSFGPDHQLRQPLYRVRRDASGREAAEEIRSAAAEAAGTASGGACGPTRP